MLRLVYQVLFLRQMAVVHPVTFDTFQSAEAEFWQECRHRAELLNIPAWKLAEDYPEFVRESVNSYSID